MAAYKISIILLLSVGLIGIASIFLFQRDSDTHHHSVDLAAPSPSLEVLPDRIIARVTAQEALHPATTTPLDPDGPKSHWFYSEPIVLPDDIIISGFAVEIEDADFSTLHHVNVGVMGRLASLCTLYGLEKNLSIYELFTASRHTPQPALLPAPYGLPVRQGEALSIEFMTHPLASPHGAHHAEDQIVPTLKVTMFTDATRTEEARYLRLRLDDTPCVSPTAHQAFVIPVGTAPFVKKADAVGGSARYTFSKPGVIIVAGANFWPTKGGRNVTAYLNDDVIDVREAVPGDTPYEWRIPRTQVDIPFVADDTITISAEYNNPFLEPIQDGSGMYGFYYSYHKPIVFTSVRPSATTE